MIPDLIETQRYSLRRLTPEDLPALARSANDIDVARRLGKMPHPYTLSDAKEWFARKDTPDWTVRAVFDGDEFLGVLGAEEQFGYWYGRHAWGRGVATEAGQAYLSEYFACGGCDLVSGYLEDNFASRNVLRKLGFTETGDAKIETLMRDDVTSHRMELSAEAWFHLKGLPLQTKRLQLRPVLPTDAKAYLNLFGQKEVARNLTSFRNPISQKDIDAFLHKYRFRNQIGFILGMFLPGGRLIGSIGLGGEHQPSVAYAVDPQFWGQGYMTEALSAFLKYSFNHFDLTMITSDVFSDNPASTRVLVKHGFEECGQSVSQSKARLEPVPVILYRLTRDIWEHHAR